ncbi:acetolactate synthase-1/2/3 large subunit [Bryocella elongata]|uniref:Acetolactate synthase-1/2/3 large subunit n=1 Tax=Bryocella elongata TaxID=863522 RepID=A0A1H5SVH6_9BACT|nr:thiamine pyrophosphate-binding protein [Bryocella elongata]SEF53871.1 acetolactate synthase-1/2/3 large subunit [Bryocella elongata]
MKLSDYVMKYVADQGVSHVFLVTGGGAMHLNQSLGAETRLTPVCNSHEQASAICAEGFAKAVNGLGCCMVTTGPGGTNAVTGVAGAWLDSTPVLYLSGQVKRPDRMFDAVTGKPLGMRQLGVQEIDICSIVGPITKYAVTVLEPSDIRYHLEKAVYLALNGRPGPVWIDIPLDVQASPIDETNLRGFNPDEYAHADFIHGTSNIAEEVERAIEAFNKCERPLLFCGNGVRLARAEKEFEELRKYLGVPTVATWCAADLVPSDDPTYVGRPGTVAARGANFALQNCDFLLSLGVRLDMAITGYAPQNLAREAHKVVVDIDAAELGKLHPHMQQPVCADAKVFLTELLKHKDRLIPGDIKPWLARCADWKTRYAVVTDEHRKPEGPVSIFNLAEVLGNTVKPADRLVVGNSGSGIEIYLLACPTLHSQRLYHTAGLGAMGYAVPMAIAVATANPGREVIAVDGDGGFQFNIQELETIARLQLPIKFFVLNNDGYSSIRASQTAYFGKASIGADARTGISIPDLSKVGASYGLGTYVIEDQTDLVTEVKKVLAMDGPVVCDVHVIPDEQRAPRLQSYQRADGSFVSKPLEDLFPFLSREEFLANMIVKPLPE